jgi:hypothetical protein
LNVSGGSGRAVLASGPPGFTVVLQHRADLIPNLVKTVVFAKIEQGPLERLLALLPNSFEA